MRTMMRRLGAGAAAATVAAALAVAGTGAPASATAAECSGGANGFIDIPDTLRGSQVYAVDLGGGATSRLYVGTVSGAQRTWAMIDGTTYPGDRVWMDWTQNGGATWLQCGPFQITAPGQTKTTAAKRTSSSTSWRVRACGAFSGGPVRCGAWW
ncbi:hypothetical protein [Catenuloplanes atrovinosus]|uniref:Secreted protein n=1 Tax=Catenuloplanes atrovinosus TaxID=137266 RepID=A0AAE4CAD8_9ACTN|nr:hypothetical protein [Catenuloplanes atrovinosus]MDR7275729.1 hypothetical protein [Catenuloplanes atrovinosus]